MTTGELENRSKPRKPSAIENTLQTLCTYYDVNRQAGHTTAMIEGADRLAENGEARALILCHNKMWADKMKKMAPRAIAITANSSYHLDTRLRGYRGPLVIDNAALQQILGAALYKIQYTHLCLESAVANLKWKTRLCDEYQATIAAQRAEIARLSSPWYKTLLRRVFPEYK